MAASTCQFKTHMFMIFTGAIKNLFGVIPGLNKAAYHARLNDRRRFAEMLLDVACFVGPRLNIVDGILGMEGDGPGTGGRPRHLGVLLAGADMVAVDVACCRIAGIETSAVPVLAAARDRGLWSGLEGDVETVGVPLEQLRVKDFVMPGSYEGIGVGARSGLIDAPLRRVLRHLTGCRVQRRPVHPVCGLRERLSGEGHHRGPGGEGGEGGRRPVHTLLLLS